MHGITRVNISVFDPHVSLKQAGLKTPLTCPLDTSGQMQLKKLLETLFGVGLFKNMGEA